MPVYAVARSLSGGPGGWFGVEVALDDQATVAVLDLGGGNGRPNLQGWPAGGDLEPGGLGIPIIASLAAAIGVHGSPESGHTVWAEFDPTG